MFEWFERHARATQAVSAVITAIAAVVALLGVAWQVSATYRSQQEQSARDIYREFLTLSIANPDFAVPNYCALKGTPRAPAYEAFVHHLLFTAEQSIDMDPAMAVTLRGDLTDHAAYLCDDDTPEGYSAALTKLIDEIKSGACKSVSPCK